MTSALGRCLAVDFERAEVMLAMRVVALVELIEGSNCFEDSRLFVGRKRMYAGGDRHLASAERSAFAGIRNDLRNASLSSRMRRVLSLL
jgi:hypothetical protein